MPGNQPNMMPIEENEKSLIEETKKHRAMYPEIHYKLQPFISVTCDTIESSGVMPTQQEMDDIADGIFDDFCKIHPEMADYMEVNVNDPPAAVPTQYYGDGFRPGGYRGFRRRGIGRDFILSLLLSELVGRRFPYYPYYPYYQYYPYYPYFY